MTRYDPLFLVENEVLFAPSLRYVSRSYTMCMDAWFSVEGRDFSGEGVPPDNSSLNVGNILLQ